jgi:hypothetical protein
MTDSLRSRGEKCLGLGAERVAHPDVEYRAVIGVAAEIG